MSEFILQLTLWIGGIYLLIGFAFAALFVVFGIGTLDSRATSGTWGFRLLILPGSAFLWPLLARRCLRGTGVPPEEKTAHRCIANEEERL